MNLDWLFRVNILIVLISIWLCERVTVNSNVQVKYVNTTQQVADVLTKGSFSQKHGTQLTRLFGLLTHQTHSSNFSFVPALLGENMSKRAGNVDN